MKNFRYVLSLVGLIAVNFAGYFLWSEKGLDKWDGAWQDLSVGFGASIIGIVIAHLIPEKSNVKILLVFVFLTILGYIIFAHSKSLIIGAYVGSIVCLLWFLDISHEIEKEDISKFLKTKL